MFALNGPISFNRKALHPSVYKYNCAFVIFCALWFVVCVPIMLAIGIIYGESFITYAVMISCFAIFFIGLFAFYILSYKIKNKLIIDEYVAKLEEEFASMTLEEATAELIKNKIINANGFVCINEDFGVVPFKQAKLVFGFNNIIPISLNIYLGFKGQKIFDSIKANYVLDRALYNFIVKSDTDFFRDDNFNIVSDENFELFKKDKKAFIKKVYKGKI